MRDADAIMAVIGQMPEHIRPARIRVLVEKIGRANKGHNNGEVLAALCFHLHRIAETVPVERRAGDITAILRMIDPDHGNA